MEQSSTYAAFSMDPAHALVLLRSMPLLQRMGEDILKKIVAALKPVRFGPGEPIVKFGTEGDGLYIIWKGQAKVLSPPSVYRMSHTESLLASGDYFGRATSGPWREKYRADVVAFNEVFGLLLTHEYADLLSDSSLWDPSSVLAQGSSLVDNVLNLETMEPNLFQSLTPVPSRFGNGRAFGGQFIGQALLAATKTVKSALLVHSLHSYFLRAGDEEFPVVYQVERTFEGHSFATRHVEAMQKGKITLGLYASFKVEEEGMEHSEPMPDTPGPDEVPSREQRFDSYLPDPRLGLATRQKYGGRKLPSQPIDIRYVDFSGNFQPVRLEPAVKLEPRKRLWIRSREKIPDDQSFHRCVAAFATDYDFLQTSNRPHPDFDNYMAVSLDHAIWFHGSFKADKWLLYVVESPVAAGGRPLLSGKIYTQEGKLVMSVAQEGLVRDLRRKVANAKL